MSLILDALKRAEHERRALLPPAAGSGSALPVGSRRQRLMFLVLALGGAAALIALVALWFLPGSAPTPDAAEAPANPGSSPVVVDLAGTTPGPAVLPATQPATVPPPPAAGPEPAPSVIPGTEGVASLEELAAPAYEPAVAPPASEAPAPAEEKPVVAVAEPAPEVEVTAMPEREPGPRAESARPTVPGTLAQPAPLRRFREMPPEYRADFPALTIEVHVYDAAVARRWVMINGRRYRQGESLAEGPALTEIVRDGLVLEFRGERLLYPLNR